MKTRDFILLGLGFMCIQGIFAQGSVTHTVTLQLENVSSIRLKPGTEEHTSLVFADPDDYKKGVEQSLAAVYQVRTNRPWVVNVKSSTENFEYSGQDSQPKDMPSTVLNFRKSNSNNMNYTPLSTSAVLIAQGKQGGYELNEFGVDYKADPGFKYTYGDYSIEVVYTVSNP